jgi:hypothetical protein
MDYLDEAYNKFLNSAVKDIGLMKRVLLGTSKEMDSVLVNAYIDGYLVGRLALSTEFEAIGQRPPTDIKKDLLEKLGEGSP